MVTWLWNKKIYSVHRLFGDTWMPMDILTVQWNVILSENIKMFLSICFFFFFALSLVLVEIFFGVWRVEDSSIRVFKKLEMKKNNRKIQKKKNYICNSLINDRVFLRKFNFVFFFCFLKFPLSLVKFLNLDNEFERPI